MLDYSQQHWHWLDLPCLIYLSHGPTNNKCSESVWVFIWSSVENPAPSDIGLGKKIKPENVENVGIIKGGGAYTTRDSYNINLPFHYDVKLEDNSTKNSHVVCVLGIVFTAVEYTHSDTFTPLVTLKHRNILESFLKQGVLEVRMKSFPPLHRSQSIINRH